MPLLFLCLRRTHSLCIRHFRNSQYPCIDQFPCHCSYKRVRWLARYTLNSQWAIHRIWDTRTVPDHHHKPTFQNMRPEAPSSSIFSYKSSMLWFKHEFSLLSFKESAFGSWQNLFAVEKQPYRIWLHRGDLAMALPSATSTNA